MQGQISFQGGRVTVARPVINNAADAPPSAASTAAPGTFRAPRMSAPSTGGVTYRSPFRRPTSQALVANIPGGILDGIRSSSAAKRKTGEDDSGDAKRQKKDKSFPFLELPPEIRNMIYEYVCLEVPRSTDVVKHAIAIIGVSEQVRSEALSVMLYDVELHLGLMLYCPCCHDSHGRYPVQKVDPTSIILYHPNMDYDVLFERFPLDLHMLSSLKSLRVTFWDHDVVGFFEIGGLACPSYPMVFVEFDDDDIYGKYGEALELLLEVEVDYYAREMETSDSLPYSKSLLAALLKPARIIQRAIHNDTTGSC